MPSGIVRLPTMIKQNGDKGFDGSIKDNVLNVTQNGRGGQENEVYHDVDENGKAPPPPKYIL